MIRHLTRVGDSYALVLDEEILGLIGGIEPDTPVELTVEGRRLVVTPVRDTERRRAFLAARESSNRKHGETLRRLAAE